ncbi:hypothetical protein NE237_002065 [Protea cynaroides]|uniref:Zinc finger LSD1-type domain-containing protein n=1 Tax=Protea cynaroides TaxID=273540 RepID=A0A9Q0KVD4_9MAGN|nr:hypothetical protein NE237_002065 [Protea cynaroides]
MVFNFKNFIDKTIPMAKQREPSRYNRILSFIVFPETRTLFGDFDRHFVNFAWSWSLGMQSQLICNGCRNLLLYPRGATNVRCAICHMVTSAPPPGMEMAQLVCGGCRTLLMHNRGATSVRCACCQTINLARPASSNVAHVNCGQCHTMLLYPYGAPSVKCAVCQYVTNIGGNMRAPIHVQRPNGTSMVSSSTSVPHAHGQTVVVENPMSMDESGKLVSNVVVGITTEKK